MKCYLLLYGIGRNKENIKSVINFFQFIEPEIIIYYSYLKVKNINNERTSEYGNISYKNINRIVENTEEIKIDENIKSSLLNYSKKFEDGHCDSYKSNSNLINQLFILKNLYTKIQNIESNEHVIVFRDDIKFDRVSKLIFKIMWKKIKISNKVCLSAFSWHGGFNDKFFISNKKNAEILLNRIDYAKDSTSFYKHLNAEELLLFISQKFNLTIYTIFCRVGRVRINGSVKWDPFFPSLTRINDLIRVVRHL